MKTRLLTIICFTIVACGSPKPKAAVSVAVEQTQTEKLLKSVAPGFKEKFKLGDNVKISYITTSAIDSVQILVNDKPIAAQEFVPTKVGRVNYRVVAYKNGNQESLGGQFEVFARTKPEVQKVSIIRSHKHDPKAYTQGLLYHNGRFIESTGERGRSSIREVEIATGKVLRKRDLDKKYFGEGVALLSGKLYQLTWEEGVIFIYDLNDFDKRSELPLVGEGWGVTSDGTHLYVTDGSNRITKYDPERLRKISHIEVADERQAVANLNELEWINGKIWANIYTSNLIAIIDPESGAVIKYLDCGELIHKIGNSSSADVLNGIAHDPSTGRIWLTGKDWDTLFEIRP